VDPQHIDRRDIDNIRRRVMNIEKIRRELRWTPEVTLERGLRDAYAWMRVGAGFAAV
jgi:UDP-glucose 4-epimerase